MTIRMSPRFNDGATRFAESVLAGDNIQGPWVRASCARHLDDLEHAHKRGYLFKPELAQPVLKFFPNELKHFREEFDDQPFELLPWQQFILISLYGWVNKEDGSWRFRRAYLETAKGSGKTPLAAGLALHRIGVCTGRYKEAFFLGRDSGQADVAFSTMLALSEKSQYINARSRMLGGSRPYVLFFDHNSSSLKKSSKSSRGKGKSGPTPTLILADEYHEVDSDEELSLYEFGVKKIRSPLTLITTNSGKSELTPCYAEHERAIKVATREIEDDMLFSFVCALDEGDDWKTDESCWYKTNPSLEGADQPGLKYLRAQVKQAEGMPARAAMVGRLNFCEWSDADELWIDREKWLSLEVSPEEAADPESMIPDEEDLRSAGVPCYLGLDLSSKQDLTSLAVVFDFTTYDAGYYAIIHALTPEATLKDREERDEAPYSQWVNEGYLETCPGSIIRPAHVVKWIQDCVTHYHPISLAYDRWKMDEIEQAMEEDKIETTRKPGESGLLLVPHEQGFRTGEVFPKGQYEKATKGKTPYLFMPRSIEALEQVVLDGQLRIRFSPPTRWAGLSAKLESDPTGQNKAFTKRRSKGRIDCLVALTMAVGNAVLLPKALKSLPKNPLEHLYREIGLLGQ